MNWRGSLAAAAARGALSIGATFLRMVRACLLREKVEPRRYQVTPFQYAITYPRSLFTNMATNSIKLLTGNSYPELARLVADRYVQGLQEVSEADPRHAHHRNMFRSASGSKRQHKITNLA